MKNDEVKHDLMHMIWNIYVQLFVSGIEQPYVNIIYLHNVHILFL